MGQTNMCGEDRGSIVVMSRWLGLFCVSKNVVKAICLCEVVQVFCVCGVGMFVLSRL